MVNSNYQDRIKCKVPELSTRSDLELMMSVRDNVYLDVRRLIEEKMRYN